MNKGCTDNGLQLEKLQNKFQLGIIYDFTKKEKKLKIIKIQKFSFFFSFVYKTNLIVGT